MEQGILIFERGDGKRLDTLWLGMKDVRASRVGENLTMH